MRDKGTINNEIQQINTPSPPKPKQTCERTVITYIFFHKILVHTAQAMYCIITDREAKDSYIVIEDLNPQYFLIVKSRICITSVATTKRPIYNTRIAK